MTRNQTSPEGDVLVPRDLLRMAWIALWEAGHDTEEIYAMTQDEGYTPDNQTLAAMTPEERREAHRKAVATEIAAQDWLHDLLGSVSYSPRDARAARELFASTEMRPRVPGSDRQAS